MNIREYEENMWQAAKNRDSAAFLRLVNEDAVMVCGGYRMSGRQYAGVISDFDVAEYEISRFEIVAESDEICQVHYVIETKVADERNIDLQGVFHVTSTWKKQNGEWKLVFNMDQRA